MKITYHKHLKLMRSVTFCTFKVFYNHRLYLIKRHFTTRKGNPTPTEQLLSIPVPFSLGQITSLHSVSMVLQSGVLNVHGIIQYGEKSVQAIAHLIIVLWVLT